MASYVVFPEFQNLINLIVFSFSVSQLSVNACLRDLNKMLKEEKLSCPFLQVLAEDMKDNVYKGQHEIQVQFSVVQGAVHHCLD